jgi:type I restriction enzyme M protein
MTHDIVAKLWNLCNVLKDDGVTYHQYVTELTYLLFLKMAKETGTEDQLPAGLPLGRPGSQSRARPAGVLQDAAHPPGQPRLPAGAGDLRQRQLLHQEARHALHPGQRDRQARLVQRPQEGLGDLYEGLLEKNANEKKSGAGQYFTPRPLIDSMVAVMKPTLDDIIQDPAAGTGGFLIAANHYILRPQRPDSPGPKPSSASTGAHLLRHGARAGHPPPGADEPDAARHRFDPEAGGIRYGDTLSPKARPCPRPR